jgi:signal transduction histidine kinase
MSGATVLILMIIFSIPLLAILVKSDIGRAIADAIRHNSGANEGAAARQEIEQMRGEIEQLRTDLDDMHTQLLETQERLDFAERLLASGHEPSHERLTP